MAVRLYTPNLNNLGAKSPIVSGLHLKYSRFSETTTRDRARSALRGVGRSLGSTTFREAEAGLSLAWPRHQLTARGLAAGEAKGSQEGGKPAGGQRSGQRGDVHADAAPRHDDSRRGYAAHQFRSLGRALMSVQAA